MGKQFDPLQELKNRQTKLLPGVRDKPFLEDPASFQSAKDPEDVIRSQKGQYAKIPKPDRDPPVLDLAEVIGAEAVAGIEQGKQLVFHAVGDTGNPKHSDLGAVVPVMSRDYYRPAAADRPALFLHLGDVCYNQYEKDGPVPASKLGMYHAQFYAPYADYPGKIIAIPGNHDSNPQEDPRSIKAFQKNFCAPLPKNSAALDELLGSKTRPPMYQPGVYYRFDAPFAQVLALFSNGGEFAGVLRSLPGAPVGNRQWKWLLEQLAAIRKEREANPAARRALIVAVHHPPFSSGGGHQGSKQMLEDLDSACCQAKIIPDAVFSGHAHNYQRYTRTVTSPDGQPVEVPYVVAGNGGHGITTQKPKADGSRVKTPLAGAATPGVAGGASLRQYFDGYGHLLVKVTPAALTVDLIGTHTNTPLPVDSVTLDLNARKITHEAPPLSHPAAGEEEKYRV